MQYTIEQAYDMVSRILDLHDKKTPIKLTFEDGSTFTGWPMKGVAAELKLTTEFEFADGATYPEQHEERNRKRFHITQVVKAEHATK